MSFKFHHLPKSRLQVVVELTTEEVAIHFDQALDHLSSTVKLSGFRTGKAPLELIKQNLDPEKLREEAYTLAVQVSWTAISKQLTADSRQPKADSPSVIPIQDPEVDLGEFESDRPATITFEFDIRPAVTVGDWRGIKIKNKNFKIKDKEGDNNQEVNDLIETLRRAHAKTISKLTPATIGDKVHLDFEGSIGGARLDKLTSKNFPIILGQSNTIPGFDQQLVGLKRGDKKQFNLTFPPDHFDKGLVNQTVEFKTEIKEVFEIILPELNDEFAKQFGHTKTVQLTKAIREDIGNRMKDEQFISQKAQWLAEFEKLVEVDLPESLIRVEVERSREAWRAFLQQRHLNENEWLKSRDLTLEQLEKDWYKAASASVKIGLGLAEVAKTLKKELLSNEEFQEFLDELVKKANL